MAKYTIGVNKVVCGAIKIITTDTPYYGGDTEIPNPYD